MIMETDVAAADYPGELTPAPLDAYCWIGIDPGKKGGLAAIYSSPDGGQTIQVNATTMPQTQEGILKWLLLARTEHNLAVLEKISTGFPGSGKSNVAKLYGSYTALRMALVCCDIDYLEVSTVTAWRALRISPREDGESSTSWKRRLKDAAKQLFHSKKITLAVSDAMLFAYYARIVGENRRRKNYEAPPASLEEMNRG